MSEDELKSGRAMAILRSKGWELGGDGWIHRGLGILAGGVSLGNAVRIQTEIEVEAAKPKARPVRVLLDELDRHETIIKDYDRLGGLGEAVEYEDYQWHLAIRQTLRWVMGQVSEISVEPEGKAEDDSTDSTEGEEV